MELEERGMFRETDVHVDSRVGNKSNEFENKRLEAPRNGTK
jgi:hypothetical protein